MLNLLQYVFHDRPFSPAHREMFSYLPAENFSLHSQLSLMIWDITGKQLFLFQLSLADGET